MIRRRLATGLLALALLLLAASIVLIAISGTLGTAAAVAAIAGAAVGVGTVAVMVRRINVAQAIAVASSANERETSGRMIGRLDAIDGRLQNYLEAQHSTAGHLKGELAEIRSLVERINPGPDWTAAQWAEIDRRLTPGKHGIEEVTRRLVARDTSALLALHELVTITGEPPATTGYAASPETLLALVSMVAELPDGAVVVEAGSGLSTVWLALQIKQSGKRISIVSLEHDPEYAEATRAALSRQRLGDAVSVEVRDAPLAVVNIDGADYRWYDLAASRDIPRIDLLFVDGPPAATGAFARYPAVPLLRSSFVDNAVVILDDTDRKEERVGIERWITEVGAGSMLNVERELDRATVLRYRRNTAAESGER